LRPISTKIRDLPAGFLVPVAILIAISFPPLFGHELIALLCGVVYGLWIGFAIVAAGTFLGEGELAGPQRFGWQLTIEVGTWFAFKYAFRKKAIKLERTNLNYGALARVTRDGGFLVLVDKLLHGNTPNSSQVVLIIRFSIIPSHFSTAVFSTCNVKFWYFAIATFLTLPKQIILVYIGVLFVQQSKDNTVNGIVLGITFLTTVFAGAYIYTKMRKTKTVLLQEQAARLDGKRTLSRDLSPDANIEVSESFFQPETISRSGKSVRPPTPTWQEGMYEMDDIGRQGIRMQEFI
jgi:uncharacterized membrane protein YdjX (TVP38/TMEM64 family)